MRTQKARGHIYLKMLHLIILSLLYINVIFAQEINVTGKIIDENTGEPLPGVNVLIKGTATGTISNYDGDYSINVPDQNSILVFSFIGYQSKEINVAGKTIIDVSLTVSAKELEEVVVIGYGVQKKSFQQEPRYMLEMKKYHKDIV